MIVPAAGIGAHDEMNTLYANMRLRQFAVTGKTSAVAVLTGLMGITALSGYEGALLIVVSWFVIEIFKIDIRSFLSDTVLRSLFTKRTAFVFLTLLSFSNPSFGQATYTASATGNWSSAATWANANNNRTGTITASTTSTTVTGSGTSFTTELSVGSVIGTQAGAAIGTVASIQSNTQLTLTANSTSAATAATYRTTDGPGGAIDAVIVNVSVTVTVDGTPSCASVSLGSGSGTATLTFASSGSPKLTVSGAVVCGNSGNANRGGTITFTSGSTLECGSLSLGAIAGQTNTALTMTNGGYLKVNGALTYFAGTWTPGTGTVELTANNTIPASGFTSFNNLVISSGTTTLGANLNSIATTGSLTVKAGATLALSTFTFGATTPIPSVSLECGGATAASITGTGVMTLGGNIDVTDNGGGTSGASITCPIALGASRTITVADDGTSAADLTMGGVVSGTGFAITKDGVGTLVLSGTNTYTGATTISAGVLNVQNAQGTGTTAGGVSVASGAALELQGGITVGAEALTINNVGIGNAGALRNISGNNTWGGTITISTNAARINSDAGTLTLSAANSITGTNIGLTVGGSGNTTISGTITSGSGSLTKDGSGTLLLSGANTYSGNTTVSSGMLRLGAADRIDNSSNLVLDGGTFSSGAAAGFSETVGTLNLTSNSTIAFGTGAHSFILSASNGITWTTGSTLTVTGWSGSFNGTTGTAGKLFVGTASGGLTSGQLAQIVFVDGSNNVPAVQLSTGEIVPQYSAPTNLSYTTPNVFSAGAAITNLIPTVTGIVASYSISPSLPTGLSFNTTTGVISGTPTATAAATSYTVTATNPGGSATTSLSIQVIPGSASKLVISSISTQTAGTSFSVTVSSQDANGNAANVTSNSDITLSLATGTGSLSGTFAGTIANGTSSVTISGVTYTVAETISVTATQASGTPSLTSATSNSFSVSPASLSKFSVESSSGGDIPNQTSGTAFTIKVTAQDLYGNTVTSFSGAGNTVSISSTGTLSAGSGTTAAFTNGVLASHSVTISNTGTFTITATRSSGGVQSGTSNSFGAGRYLYAVASANWDVGTTWSLSSAGATCNCTPTSSDIVYIGETATLRTVTIPAGYSAACSRLVFGDTTVSNASTLTLNSSTSSLTVEGDLIINRPSGSNLRNVLVNAGTATIKGSIKFGGTFNNANRRARLTITTGTVTVSGNLEFNVVGGVAVNGVEDHANTVHMSGGAGTLSIGGAFTIAGSGGLYPGTTSTVNYFGNAAQTIPIGTSFVTYNNLRVNNTSVAGATLSAAITATNVVGNITVGDTTGSLLNTGNFAVTLAASKSLTVSAGSTLNAGSSAITFGTTGTATINGTFKLSDADGFSGSTTTSIVSTNNPTITLGANSTIEYNSTSSQTVTARNYANLTSSSTGARTLPSTGTIGVSGTFTPGSNTYTITGSTIDFNGSGSQTIPAFNYNNLTSSSTGARTLASGGTIGVSGTFTPGSNSFTNTGSTINFNGGSSQTIPAFNYNNLTSSSNGARTLASSGTIGVSGAFTPGSNSYTTTGSTVSYNNTAGGQTVSAFTYNSLSMANTSGTQTAGGAITVNGSLSLGTGSTFQLSTNTLTLGSGSSVTGSGTLVTQGLITDNRSSKSYSGTFEYAKAGAQTVNAGTYNNLTISGSGNNSKTFSGSLTVNGVLNLTSSNASASAGALAGASANDTLYMGASATTTGTGDVSGIIKRTSIAANTNYTFGNQFTSLYFTNTGTLPSSVSVQVTLANPTWKTNAINRYYSLIQTGGTSACKVNLRLHYLDSELNGVLENSSVDFFDYQVSGAVHDHGHNLESSADNWVEISSLSVDYIAPSSSSFSAKYWTLGQSTTPNFTWLGGVSTDWTLKDNWSTDVPGSSDDVIIPNAATTDYDPTLPSSTTIKSMSIATNGVLNGGTSTALTLVGGSGSAWMNDGGTFNPGTSTVTFTGTNGTIGGTTTFNNVTIGSGATTQMVLNGILKVAGTLTKTGTLDVLTYDNTIEFNGSSSQSVPSMTYHDLVLSGSGGKTMPSTLSLEGDWTNNCSAAVTTTSSTVTFSGSAAQVIDGTASTTFNSLTLNNTAGLTLSGVDATVNGTLTFTAGKIVTGSQRLSLGASASISGSGSDKYVYGNLRRYVANAASPSLSFPVGDASSYTPADITFSGTTAGSGYLDVSTAALSGAPATASGLSSTKYVNRKWTVTNTGVTGFTSYSPTFTFVAGDILGSATPSDFVIRKLDGATWSATTNGTRTSTTTQATGVASFSEFYIGETSGAPSVSTQPSNSTICTGSNTSFTSASTSSPTPTVQWQRSTNGSSWTDVSGSLDAGTTYSSFTTGTVSLTGSTTSLNGYQYRAVFTNINGSANSNAATLTVKANPSVAAAGADQAQCDHGQFVLAGNSPSSGAGTWTVASGSATIWDASSATSLVSGVGVGASATLVWSIANAPCAASNDTVVLTVRTGPVASATATSVSCYGDSSSVTVTASGGTSPYSGTGTFKSPAGGYSYTVTDSYGCAGTVTGNVTQPGPIAVSGTSTVSSCSGNSPAVSVQVTGGTEPYTYSTAFDNSGDCTVTIIDHNGCQKSATIPH